MPNVFDWLDEAVYVSINLPHQSICPLVADKDPLYVTLLRRFLKKLCEDKKVRLMFHQLNPSPTGELRRSERSASGLLPMLSIRWLRDGNTISDLFGHLSSEKAKVGCGLV
jgi:hypothetical protein